jgi:hypothetical protein
VYSPSTVHRSSLTAMAQTLANVTGSSQGKRKLLVHETEQLRNQDLSLTPTEAISRNSAGLLNGSGLTWTDVQLDAFAEVGSQMSSATSLGAVSISHKHTDHNR